jgi:hypothetical protein
MTAPRHVGLLHHLPARRTEIYVHPATRDDFPATFPDTAIATSSQLLPCRPRSQQRARAGLCSTSGSWQYQVSTEIAQRLSENKDRLQGL